jgi:hypothetical protein
MYMQILRRIMSTLNFEANDEHANFEANYEHANF